MVPAIGRTTPRLPRFRDRAFVTPETDDRVPAEACLSKDETPRNVARTVEDGPWKKRKEGGGVVPDVEIALKSCIKGGHYQNSGCSFGSIFQFCGHILIPSVDLCSKSTAYKLQI